jgi:hypothetical protein
MHSTGWRGNRRDIRHRRPQRSQPAQAFSGNALVLDDGGDYEGIAQAATLARQIALLLDGSFAVVLLHRDPSYMETAGEAAASLRRAARRAGS